MVFSGVSPWRHLKNPPARPRGEVRPSELLQREHQRLRPLGGRIGRPSERVTHCWPGYPKSWPTWGFQDGDPQVMMGYRLKNTKSWSNDWFGGLGLFRKPPFGHFYGKKRVFIFEHWEISPLLPGSNGEMMFFNCNPAIFGYILMIRPSYA